jgi:hypothetical protein
MTRAVGKEYVSMFARFKRPLLTLQLFTFTSLAVCSLSLPAWAQADQEGARPGVAAPDDQEEEEAEGEANKTPAAVGQTAQVETTAPAKPAVATAAADQDPREPVDATDGLYRSKMKLGWDGSAEIDVGQARYGYSLSSFRPERLYDFRGRFVMGPVLEYDFDENHFFRLTGQVVAWVREEGMRYQVNADDVYVQAGRRKKWDIKLGRFESWVVYRKGLGYDPYTLEDTGAMKEGPFNQAIFGADIYEVNRIYWREMAGKLAVHVYPLDILGFELLALYGSETQTTNSIGSRFAADLDLKFLRIRAGAEYRKDEPTVEVRKQENGVDVVCDKCSDKTLVGFGGGAVGKLGPVELGVNVAKADVETYKTDGTALEPPATYGITSFGGYLELDPGKLLFERSLIVGVGVNRTEKLYENEDFERHDQNAAYIAFPLGFNDAMIKLVVSKADLLFEDADSNTHVVVASNKSDMVSGRLRVRFSF